MAPAMFSASFGTLIWGILCSVVCYILYNAIYDRYFHPLAQFPGPFWASVTRIWIAYHNAKGDEVDVCRALHEKHGPVIRVTPTMLLVSDATKIPVIYHRAADKSRHYLTGAIGPHEGMFNMQEHKTHARYRKIAAGPYSFTSIKKMEPLIDAQIRHWLSKLGDVFASADNGPKSLDFTAWAKYLAFDVVSEVGFGAPFGFIDQGRDVGGLMKGMDEGLLPFGIMARMYPLTDFLKSTFLGRYMVAGPEDKSGFGVMMRFRDALVAKRLQDTKDGITPRVDLLQTFIDARDEQNKPLPLDYIKTEVLLVMLAGADTTGSVFIAFVNYMLENPAIFKRLMAEVDNATKEQKLSTPIPRYEEVTTHCPYYLACFNETLRLQPPAPSIFPRLVSKGGIELGGKFVPEGTEVTANAYLAHRDKNVFGQDADVFRPERWLESEDRSRELLRYMMTFGYGSRVCLGQYVAQMELYKAPLQFFRAFRPRICDTSKPIKYEVKGGVACFTDMWITIENRTDQ